MICEKSVWKPLANRVFTDRFLQSFCQIYWTDNWNTEKIYEEIRVKASGKSCFHRQIFCNHSVKSIEPTTEIQRRFVKKSMWKPLTNHVFTDRFGRLNILWLHANWQSRQPTVSQQNTEKNKIHSITLNNHLIQNVW